MRGTSTSPHAPTLLLDLDGTVALGDEPVFAYADALAESAEAPELGSRVRRFVEVGRDDAHQVDDGYQLAQVLGREYALDDERISRAYHDSRARVTAGEVPMHAAAGLHRAADAVHAAGGRVVLVTNAPSLGLDAVLERMRVADAFDAVVGDARKPGGMASILDELLAEGAAPGRIASVGDIWRNDLEPAYERGCRTGLIDRFGLRRGPADWVAPDLAGLVPEIEAWAAA
ncbi:HAD family hydrolase [Agromyces sp. SYSU T00194]|uniref:HAD family hydrolase n=1 Tax=Agromyces chitinivorans TaxID=3158560 RepID=UPI00339A63F4